ncbi:DUF362 domain-containing protein [Desulfosediminicola flagellatus]|uniref:DUF362 domain-containing protein n=1 Tax=Desulfosediminicola flagellatus TaxID=2569541 RepID=UPI00142ED848|nr:DUF362 domain-containing protein [Desulfosediminicola flagellatus]
MDSIDIALSNLELPASLTGLRVLVKPNLISSRGPALACTHGAFLAAVVQWLGENGAQVIIGDSPAFGTTQSVMDKQGISHHLSGLQYKQVKFSTPVSKTLSNNLSVDVAAEALDCDLFLNLPRLKAHNQMFMTGAVKNIFGIVVGMRKAMLHMVHGSSHHEFADIIIRLSELLPPHLSLIDCIEVMHRSGPLDGELLGVGCIGASRCPVALDTSMLDILEVSPNRSPLWKAATSLNIIGSDPRRIVYPFDNPACYHGSGFVTPEGLNPVRFNPFRFLLSSIRRIRLAIRA